MSILTMPVDEARAWDVIQAWSANFLAALSCQITPCLAIPKAMCLAGPLSSQA